ncbi:MAG: hypothetical protein KDE33_06390 [Bacteroidetes bacterium]|nr:hypothetical protein [Bacteroidota bacterium]
MSIPNYSQYLNDLTEVNLVEASQETTSSFDTLSKKSGIYILEKYLDRCFPESDYFLDLSFISGAIGRDGLPDFIFLKNKIGYFDAKGLIKKYPKIYEYLREENLGPYYQKNFFYKRQEFSKNSFTSNTYKEDLKYQLPTSQDKDIIYYNSCSSIIFNHSLKDFNYNEFIKKVEDNDSINLEDSLSKFYTLLTNEVLIADHGKISHKLLLAMPIISSPNPSHLKSSESNKFLTGQGALFVFFVSKNEINIEDDIISDLQAIVKDFSYNYIFYQAEKLAKRAKYESIKSAKAAIMSRNVSHNLGSHVIYYIKNAIEDFENLHTYPSLAELDLNNGKIELSILASIRKDFEISVKEENTIKAPFLRGLIRFLNYIQERHDYIATISNDYNPYLGSVNFKDFIYDILLPDKKVERHKNEDLEKFKEQNLLLDYIAKSENFDSKSIDIYFKKIDVKGYFTPVPKNSIIGQTEEPLNYDSHLKFLREIEVSLPSGIMGRQAFFSIFENYIRNSAKHNEGKSEKIEIIIGAKQVRDYYHFYLYDINNKTSQQILESKILPALEDAYVNDEGKLNENYKGIKEMRISAAWLRQLNVEDIDEKNLITGNEYEKLLTARLVDREGNDALENEQGSLCYEFKIPVSKKMAIISSNPEVFNKESNNIKHDYLSPQQYLAGAKNYKLVIFVKNETHNAIDYELKKEIKAKSAVRFLEIKENRLKDKLDVLYLELYKEWINSFCFQNTEKNDSSTARDYRVYIEDKNQNSLTHNNSKISNIHIKVGGDSYSPWPEEKGLIIFKTHNDTETFFEAFKKSDSTTYENTGFLEGISGHNSTDRLIRHEELDEEWRLKMVESGLAKITIVDERIFDNLKTDISVVDKTDFSNAYRCNVQEFETFFENEFADLLRTKNIKQKNGEELDNFIFFKNDNAYKKIVEIIPKKNVNFEENDFNKIIEGCIQALKISIKNNLQKDNFNFQLLNKKNIRICNLVINGKNNTKNRYVLSDLNKEYSSIESKDKKTSHFVVVHHSIIEKIRMPDETMDDAFDKFKEIFPLFEKGRYIIHSGRSKPNDLPKGVGFAQFSSVEAALNDCKFSLSELMFNAIIEKPDEDESK